MPYVTTHDGQSLYVRVIGRGQPCVLLHGFGMNSTHWLPFVLPLAHRYCFYLPDFRGFGRSHFLSYSQDCILTDNALDLHAVLEHFGLRDIALAGLSLGATTSLHYFSLFGHSRVRAYLHIDQAPRILHNEEWKWGLFGHEGPTRLAYWRELADQLGLYPADIDHRHLPDELRSSLWRELGYFMAAAMRHRPMKKLALNLSRMEPVARQLFPVDNWYVYYQCLRAYLSQDYDMRALLPDLHLPVTVLAGRQSEMYPWEGQAYMAERLPQGQLVTLENAGHAPMIDQPAQFVRALRRFLDHCYAGRGHGMPLSA